MFLAGKTVQKYVLAPTELMSNGCVMDIYHRLLFQRVFYYFGFVR